MEHVAAQRYSDMVRVCARRADSLTNGRLLFVPPIRAVFSVCAVIRLRFIATPDFQFPLDIPIGFFGFDLSPFIVFF